MFDSADEWNRMLEGIRSGDADACQAFWNHYRPLIVSVANRYLSTSMDRRVGPDSVLQSACRTFFRRAQTGEFELPDAESLWRLLCAITITKVRNKARYHRRRKRDLKAETHVVEIDQLVDDGPSPEDEVEFEDQLQTLLCQFQEEERHILELKLQECTNDDIATRLGCSERTVRRMMQRIRARLEFLIRTDSTF